MWHCWRFHHYKTPKARFSLKYLERLQDIALLLLLLKVPPTAAHKPHPTTRHPPIAVKKLFQYFENKFSWNLTDYYLLNQIQKSLEYGTF